MTTAVRVKICGITHAEDAQAAVAAGAAALGFMFYAESPRAVSFKEAARIIAELPPFVSKVGVFVNPEPDWVEQAIGECGLDTLQFHGEEPTELTGRFGLKTIKAFRMRDATSLEALPGYRTDAWLLDSYQPGQRGGTGARFNWDLAVEAKQWGRPIILAGGLTPENAAKAVRRVRPFGLDVSSGVEYAPGRKDPGKVRQFIRAALTAAWEEEPGAT